MPKRAAASRMGFDRVAPEPVQLGRVLEVVPTRQPVVERGLGRDHPAPASGPPRRSGRGRSRTCAPCPGPGSRAPVITRMAVVLPAPLGPSSTVMRPLGAMIDRWDRAGTRPNVLDTSRTSTTRSLGSKAPARRRSPVRWLRSGRCRVAARRGRARRRVRRWRSRESPCYSSAWPPGAQAPFHETGRQLARIPIAKMPSLPAGVHHRVGGVASLVRVFVLGLDPGLSRCGYAVVEPGRRGSVRPVALGVLTTPPDHDLPDRLAELQRDLRALFDEHAPRVGGRRAGPVPGQRAHGHGGGPGQRAGHGRGRQSRLRGRAVLARTRSSRRSPGTGPPPNDRCN